MNIYRSSYFIVALWSVMCIKIAKGQQMSHLPTNQLMLPPSSHIIPFEWHGDSLGSKWEPHAYLLLPVQILDCPKQFYMQFDLGSPYSLFYREELTDILKNYGSTAIMTDSTQILENYTFHIGKMPVTAKSIAVEQFNGQQLKKSVFQQEVVIIGTLGADFIDGRIILIDYPQKCITNALEMPIKLMPNAEMTEFSFINRSVLLPVTLNGANSMLFFDTGSSAFELLTSKQDFDQMATPGALPVQNQVSSWNKILTAHTIQTSDSLKIASRSLPIRHVTYIEGASANQIERMRKLGIGGMTGNKIFLYNRLLLDTRNQKFAVLAPK